MFQIDCGVPAGIVFAMATDRDVFGTLPKLGQFVKRANHFLFAAHDAYEALHHFLEIILHLVWAFTVGRSFGGAIEWLEGLTSSFFNLSVVNLASVVVSGKVRGEFARPFAEYKQVGQRISPEAIRPVQAGSYFASG